ncbi:hypothetical protein EYF80_065898 [Liparis tanakae]|uniref:Uncharacterized protein n=1 Tax=Liparis tanakae TaxID=230148 RepID=A0A4Z2E5D5_9TELE|nr:hypothetical protein EYF80_065898 [Liparis tanakae]
MQRFEDRDNHRAPPRGRLRGRSSTPTLHDSPGSRILGAIGTAGDGESEFSVFAQRHEGKTSINRLNAHFLLVTIRVL